MSAVKPLSENQANKYIEHLPDWDVGIEARAIHGEYAFKNFRESLAFVNKVGELAEKMNHHPDINFGYDYVDITLSTHTADGLTAKDFELAKQICELIK